MKSVGASMCKSKLWDVTNHGPVLSTLFLRRRESHADYAFDTVSREATIELEGAKYLLTSGPR